MSDVRDQMYLAVVFDLFGTLVPAYAHHAVLSEMASVLMLDRQVFITAFAEDTRDSRETGRFSSLEENIRFICDGLGHPATDDQLREAVRIRAVFTRAALSPRQGAVPILVELRNRGLGVGMISDCCMVVPALWKQAELAPYVDVAIFSCEVGVKKPDLRIYQMTYEALATPPTRCLYVGDGGSNELRGATVAGMDAVLLSVQEEDGIDPYRTEAAVWRGRTVGSLENVIELL